MTMFRVPPLRRIQKISLRDKAEALRRFYLEKEDLLSVLTDIYARYGTDASKLKRPHATIVQWRIAVDNALRNSDEALLAYCRKTQIANTEAG